MRADELSGKRVAIWGLGREGKAIIRFLRERSPDIDLTILNDATEPQFDDGTPLVSGRAAIDATINTFDVVVKSPGISLYDPSVIKAKAAGVRFTSLLNLWFAERPTACTICVTGTKGKSTTAALIAHILKGLGKTVALGGNIGIPVTEIPRVGLQFAVIEVSSYQAADFDGTCDIAVLTSLSQEHLDWHGSVDRYHRDKLSLLLHARHCVVGAEALSIVRSAINLDAHAHTMFVSPHDMNTANTYLARPHNLSNLAAALAVMQFLGLAKDEALHVAESFQPLPHRQQEIGEVDGVLFVDDSISTTPESAVAALDVYRNRSVTVIIGGHDRGIDYSGLVQRLQENPPNAVILMDESGKRIHAALALTFHAGSSSSDGGARALQVSFVNSMQDAVELARAVTPRGGVVLLSPAAPSYGRYRSFIERGEDFARCAGLLR